MTITRASSSAVKRGPAAWFSGAVWLEELAPAPSSARLRALRVTFEPEARTAWHTHPHGQALHILSGVARIQRAGEGVVELRPGDAVWFEPGERHWHGAAPGQIMVHLAWQGADEHGQTATWFEHVAESDYHRSASR